MPFACCASCGNVVNHRHGLAEFGTPVGGCPECGRAMYWTASPSAQMLVSQPATTGQPTQTAGNERLSA